LTRSKVSRRPVASFGPQLMALLLKGAKEEVIVPCPDRKTMNNLQMRLHMLRGAMDREKHVNYALVTRARTSRQWDEEGGAASNFRLRVAPNDSVFDDMLKPLNLDIDGALDALFEEAPPDTPSDPNAPTPTKSPLVVPSATPEGEALVDPYTRFKS